MAGIKTQPFPAHTGTTVWQVIQKHIHLGHSINDTYVQQQIRWFAAHPNEVELMLRNATPYIYYVYAETAKRHMPARFALLPMVESGYNPYAYSAVGAAGLWQMMPGTASSYGLSISWWYDSRRDIMTSTTAALNYLVRLHNNLNSWDLAAASYDYGEGAVEAAMAYNRAHGRSTSYWQIPLPLETREYVPKLMALAYLVKHASEFHIALPNVSDQPYFVAVKLGCQLDLAEAAKFAGVPIDVIQMLNPGMRRYATDPAGHYTLLIPADRVQTFKQNLDQVIGTTHISWQYHEVRQGETLYKIARDYHTSALVIREVNHLSSNAVAPGEGVLVPIWLNHAYQAATAYFQPANNHVVLPVTKTVSAALPALQLNAVTRLSASQLLSGHFTSSSQQSTLTANSHPPVLKIRALVPPHAVIDLKSGAIGASFTNARQTSCETSACKSPYQP